jgi:hypothetical protein
MQYRIVIRTLLASLVLQLPAVTLAAPRVQLASVQAPLQRLQSLGNADGDREDCELDRLYPNPEDDGSFFSCTPSGLVLLECPDDKYSAKKIRNVCCLSAILTIKTAKTLANRRFDAKLNFERKR